jgi:hypothetical protein
MLINLRYGSNHLKEIWLIFISLLMYYMVLLAILDNKKQYKLSSTIPLSLIFILYGFAYYFGTTNNVVYHMASASIFVVPVLLIYALMLDKILQLNIFLKGTSLVILIFVYLIINNALNNPYRLSTKVNQQNKYVNLMGGLYVDEITKKYINDLQNIVKKHNKDNQQISLIDMTGGSPGANLIMNARFFDQQWLSGGYKGSNKYVYEILSNCEDKDRMKKAWILVAPDGSRKLDLKILNKLNLDFPNAYIKIGIVKTGHRNEIQEVWKPKSD